MTERELLKLALEALEDRSSLMKWQMARDAVNEALAQPEQEPECGAIIEVFGKDWRLDYMSLPVGKHKLYTQQYTYTTPPQRKPLTDEQRKDILQNNTIQGYQGEYFDAWGIIDDVEAAHGIKENT